MTISILLILAIIANGLFIALIAAKYYHSCRKERLYKKSMKKSKTMVSEDGIAWGEMRP